MIKRTLLLALISTLAIDLTAQLPDRAKVVAGADRAFEKASKARCRRVSLSGQWYEKAHGLSEMEHNVANTLETVSNRDRLRSNS